MTLDLLPMTISELAGEALPDLILRLIGHRDFSRIETALSPIPSAKTQKLRTKLIEQYFTQGGLPGICFIRDPKLRTDRIREQLATILDRDIRLVYPTTLTYREIETFVRSLALLEGSPMQHQHLRRETGVGPITQKKLLHALESVYMVRFLPIEGDRKGLCPVFEDQAEAAFLQAKRLPRSHALTYLLYRNLRAQFTYRSGTDETYFQYRTRAGSLVPFAIRTPEGELGVIGCESPEPSRSELASAQSFIRRYGTGKCLLVTLGGGQIRTIEPRIATVPAEAIV